MNDGHRRRTLIEAAILTPAVLLIAVQLVFGQPLPRLAGLVVDESGGVISGATVTLFDTGGSERQRTTTNTAGAFSIDGLPPGQYDLRVEQRLFETGRQRVDIADGPAPAPLRVVLKIATVRDAVTVEGTSPYSRPASSAATRFDADNLLVPQSTQTIVASLIEDSGAIDVGDVLKLVPSAFAGHTRLAPFTSFSWRIRGLDAAVTRNGFRQLYFEDVDQSAFANVERLEVIKGPGGAVYGKEGLGGVIHVVTKRAEKQFAASAHTSLGQYTTRILGGDVTGPVGDTGLALRFNGEIERSDSFAAFQNMDRNNVAFVAHWDRNRRVRGFLNVEYQERNSLPHPGLPVRGTALPNGAADLKRSTYLGEPNVDYLRTWSPLTQAWVEFDVAPGWTLSPRYQHFTFNVDQQQIQLRAPLTSDPTLIQRTGRFDFHERDKTHALQLELKGKMSLGRTTHEIVAGYEVDRHSYTGDWFPYAVVPAINSLDPRFLAVPPLRASTPVTFIGDIDNNEPYVQDLISWNRLSVLAGLRRSDVTINSAFAGERAPDQNSHGSSYQVGASVKVTPSWSLFAGNSTGLSVDNIGGAVSAAGTPFEPERSKQFEAGLKHQATAVAGSVAYFNIVFENATTGDPDNPGFSLQIGEQRSQGMEAEVTWQPMPMWSLTGGLAYIDATITRSNEGDEGNRLPNVAKVQANVWSRFQIHRDVFASVGANVVGGRFGTISNTYELPTYGTVDASMGWQVSPALRAEVFAQNLFDKRYFTGNNNNSVYPGEPRTVFARLRAVVGRR